MLEPSVTLFVVFTEERSFLNPTHLWFDVYCMGLWHMCDSIVVVGLRLAWMVHILMQILSYLFFKYKIPSLKFKLCDLDIDTTIMIASN